uniref:outer membrane beta-barrel protein n=1 Tax=Roseivirga sp. TaxID=1964215 RepID=UPI004047C491
MNRLIILCSMLLFSAATIKAQTYDTEIDFGLNVKYSAVRFSEVNKKEVEDQGGTFNTFGASFGAFLQLRVNHFYFQPEIIYNRVSTKLGNQLGGGQYTYGEYDFVFHSIELPLLLGYRTSFGNSAIRVGGGLVFSFLVKTNGELYLEPGPEVIGIPQEELDAFNKVTLGSRVGIGADFGPFLFDIVYERSFSKVGEEIARQTPVVAGNESSWILSVGYKLIRAKR